MLLLNLDDIEGKNKELQGRLLQEVSNLQQDYEVNWSINGYGEATWLKFMRRNISLKQEAVG